MGGGQGDGAKRQAGGAGSSRGVGYGVPDKFADYARFDDMFGASRIFTDGTARQRKKETEMYVKDVMERRVYGYTHDLRMHGEPIVRVPVGAPLDEQASSRGKENPLDERKRRDHELGPSLDCKATGRKKARMSPGAGAFAQGGGVKPSPRAAAGFGVGRGRPSDVNGITASLFEREDWETDPLWAAMEEAVANGGVGSLEELPLPGSAVRAPALAPHPPNFDGEFMQRSRFEEIEERIHNLENSLALARAAAGTERHAPGSLPTSQTAEGAQPENGLEIKTGVPNGVFNGGFGSDRGSGGKVPQSPSPHNWAPMNPSRSSDLACDAARQASAQHGTTMGGTHRRSNSFTSTPGRGRGVPSLNDDVDEGTRLLAVENERLREHHDTNRIEHELLRTEFEHAKSQTALLRESNRNYEERVTQLERLVRECNAQTSSLRSQLADFTAGGERASAGDRGGGASGSPRAWVPPAPVAVKATSKGPQGSDGPTSAGATPTWVPTPRVNSDPGVNMKRVGSCFMSGSVAANAARSAGVERGSGNGLAQVSPDSSAGEFDGVGHLGAR